MSNNGERTINFLVGLGIGLAVGLLFAPQSGEETREWLTETAEHGIRQARRKGRRLIFEAQDLLERGEEGVSRALKSGKNALDSVGEKLG